MTPVPQKILVVDDDPHIRRLIRIYLGSTGAEVFDRATGEEAEAVAASEQFDLALIDVILPVYGGFRLAHKLRGKCRIVIMSGDESQAAAAAENGAATFLAKPFTKDELLAAVSSAPDRSRAGTAPGT